MLVRFTKAPTPTGTDTLLCVRADRTRATADLPRQGILPHLAFHFVVESTLGWRDALFGRVARGEPLPPLAAANRPTAKQRLSFMQAHQAEALIECLEAEQWGGAAEPAEFVQRLRAASRRHGVPSPEITAPELDRLRDALRDFGAAWRPLNPGASLERTF